MSSSAGLFDLAAGVVVAAAFFGYLNQRYLRLPTTTALTVMGAVVSLGALALDHLLPEAGIGPWLVETVRSIHFTETLMGGLLSFLLFAGALHLEFQAIKRSAWSILLITVCGVLISTALIGSLCWSVSALAGVPLAPAWCYLFGALISPTDPVAVLATLKSAKLPETLQATVAAESLFNDGLGIVAFGILLGIATGTRDASFAGAAELVAVEALGGVVLGLALGFLAFKALSSIDEHNIEVLITLALVMGGYALALHVSVSGPIAMATAGLIIGNQGRRLAMSENTRDHLNKFWSLLDEILNAVLFLLIGVESIVVAGDRSLALLGVAAIPMTLFARAVAMGLPFGFGYVRRLLPRNSLAILVLAGVRGGISIALALSLPEGEYKHLIMLATYTVVVFSIVVQAPLVGPAARRAFGRS